MRSKDLNALLGENLVEIRCDFEIKRRAYLIKKLDYGYFGSQTSVNRPKFESNDTTSDDNELFWNLLKCECACRADDDFFIVGQSWERRWFTASSNNDFLCFNSLSFVIVGLDFAASIIIIHGFLAGEAAGPLNVVRLILFEEVLNTAGKTSHDLVLLLLGGLPVHLQSVQLNSESLEVLIGFFVFVRNIEQSFRRDASNIEACSAQRATLFNADSL